MGATTPWPDRLIGHGILVVAELLAVPVSLLATALVVGGSGLVLHLLGVAGDFVYGAIVLASILALASFGGVAVTLYRRAFEQFDAIRPTTAILVPLLGLTPGAYGLATTGPGDLPWWAFVVTAVWAHALVYRTIAVDVSLGGHPRVGLFVGCVVAIPAIVAEAWFIALYTGSWGVVHRVVAAASGAGIPLTRSVLVLFPIGVTVAYCLRWGFRLRAAPGRLFRHLQGRMSQRSAESPSKSGPSEDWIPRSASAVGSAENTGSNDPDRTDETSHEADSNDSTQTPEPSTTSGGSDSNDRRPTQNSDAAGHSNTPSGSVTPTDGATTSGGRAEADSTTDTSSNPGTSATQGADEAVTTMDEHSACVETASNTRIFTGDTDDDGSSMALCPECSQELPITDDTQFCSKCGAEL